MKVGFLCYRFGKKNAVEKIARVEIINKKTSQKIAGKYKCRLMAKKSKTVRRLKEKYRNTTRMSKTKPINRRRGECTKTTNYKTQIHLHPQIQKELRVKIAADH